MINKGPKPSSNPLSKSAMLAKRGFFMGILSIIVAIIAIVWSTNNWLQVNDAQQQSTQNQKTLQTQSQQLQTTLQTMQQDLTTQQKALQLTQSRVATLLKLVNDNGHQRALSQIAYLIHLANLHLLINHDSAPTLALLKRARLYTQHLVDPKLIPLQRALTKDITELQAAEQFNLSATLIQLDNINNEIQKMPMQYKQNFMTKIQPAHPDQKKPWYQRVGDNLKGLENVIVIRHHQQAIMPLLSPQQELFLKENIQSKLFLAEWAALQQKPELYQHNLQQVSHWLTTYYSMNPKMKALNQQLEQLMKINVQPKLPNINASVDAIAKILNNPKDEVQQPTKNKKAKPTKSGVKA